jgi:hypothetical protein
MGRREGRAAGQVLRCCAQAGLRIGGGANPVGKEVVIPLARDPPFSPATGAAHVASTRAFFAVVFDRSLGVTAPPVMRNGRRSALSIVVRSSHWTNCGGTEPASVGVEEW